MKKGERAPKTLKRLDDAIAAMVEPPYTIRQVFYQLISHYGHPKTENFCKQLGDAIGNAREDGIIPWEWIVDTSRPVLFPVLFENVDDWKKTCLDSLRFPIWEDNPPVVFIEKRALFGIIEPLLEEYRVTGVAITGYCSKTVLHDYQNSPIIYMGDYDADGWYISGAALKVCPNLKRIAILPDQIKKYKLPTRPQDTTSKKSKERIIRNERWVAEHGDRAVELDALPKSILLQLLRDELDSRIDPVYRKKALAKEQEIRVEMEEML
jgi:hypothetical protein